MRRYLHDLVRQSASKCGAAVALTHGASTLTYEQLWRQISAAGAGFQRLGVARNDRVGIFLDKRIETVTSIFGVSVAGGVFVPINPLLRPKQVVYVLADCNVRVLITSKERYALIQSDLCNLRTLEHIVIIGESPDIKAPIVGYQLSQWMTLINDPDPKVIEQGVIDIDMAAIFYTSGSTGSPKGVVISHRNFICGAESVASYLDNNASDVILAALPLSFDAGFSQLTTGFSSGSHIILLNYLLPSDIMTACVKHGVTGLTCVPPLWIQIANLRWPEEAAHSLRYFANTGGRMPRATLDRLRSIFKKASPYLMYGLTEAFRSTYLDPSEVDHRPNSIGKAIPNAEILVVRPDGSICDANEEGELVHRGALVTLGYWNDPERTAIRFRPVPGRPAGIRTTELAVFSGDAVVRDDEGFLYFVGRKDEMIKTSGYRVSPEEIEEVIYNTAMVRDAVALGVDDESIGQAIVIAVSPLRGVPLEESVLVAELRKQLPLYMIPRKVIIRDELPRSPNGKFDRNVLRQEIVL
ncbi:acyl-CoA ligase (AMP-forming), exosortase A system-associated [Nitrobacter sp.]|uniref:acyl-CoA ligase (AMP-forming), exosortase A system-associated n=1 Tax=Nitrobacter sp. TaxID=29420 RepID=UPI0029CAC251|nr:acyl-CoA ligase (AMP-forming), exosortase A system-associated [Nitrobacter sp.]